MQAVKKIFLLSFVGLFLSLSMGFEVYSVHCKMRGQTFVSLQKGLDPCLFDEDSEEEEVVHSCCSVKKSCHEDEKPETGGCCDEEQIVVSFEPDSYFQYSIFIPTFDFDNFQLAQFCYAPSLKEIKQIYAEFPQPPPKRGREILTLHCVLRI